MKIITINSKTYGKKRVLVDDENYEELVKHKWHIIKGHNTFYVVRSICKSGIQKRLWMHRVILNSPKKKYVDHINGNGLNNQKRNIRICTKRQNSRNRKSATGSHSKYLGVCLHRRKIHNHKYWTAHIRSSKKLIWIGSYPYTRQGEINAAKAYDKKAKQLFGKFANLNFKK